MPGPSRPMTHEFVHFSLCHFLRRILVVFLVAAHFAATIGFPVLPVVEIEAGSGPFPCQHHHCGCRSAEQCWRSCCCMSTQEKSAWAKEHGVTPPDFVLAAANAESTSDASRSCCRHRHHVMVSNASDHRHTSSHECSNAHGQVGGADAAVVHGGEANRWDWVLAVHARQCQGLASLWLVSGAVLPPPLPIDAPIDFAPPLWWSDSFSSHWDNVSRRPEVPPPRCA